MSHLTIIFGPMFSGKTTRLVQELTRVVDVLEHRCLLINHVFDTRNKEIGVSSHASSFRGVSKLIDVHQTDKLEKVNIDEYNIIGVDEAQFFEDLEVVKGWVKKGKNVIVSGLITDAFMNPFGKLHTLFTFADNVIQCHSICSECIKTHDRVITTDALNSMKAAFTYKVKSNSENQIDIGASDKYIPVCRYHYDMISNK
jgi:thymidine kinase